MNGALHLVEVFCKQGKALPVEVNFLPQALHRPLPDFIQELEGNQAAHPVEAHGDGFVSYLLMCACHSAKVYGL